MLRKLQFLFIGALCGSSVIALNLYSDPACPVPAKRCPNINVTFYLYTNKTRNNPIRLNVADPMSIANANFTPYGDIKILIHGWKGNRSSRINRELMPAYFEHSSLYNIIVVDYGKLAHCFIQAVENVNLCANCTAQLMRALLPYQVQKKINVCKSHIIGASLGVSIASNITAFFNECLLYRITGLDPAFGSPTELQIRPGIAQFTDCLHTNGFFYGYFYPVCDFDAYANGGVLQPACAEKFGTTCSHAISITYFAESINSRVGFYCTEYSFYDYLNGLIPPLFPVCQLVGEFVNRRARGTCFFVTNAKSSYAQGQPVICRQLSQSSGSNSCWTQK